MVLVYLGVGLKKIIRLLCRYTLFCIFAAASEPLTTKRGEHCSPLCEPAGARTQDPILKRDVLYLLSY